MLVLGVLAEVRRVRPTRVQGVVVYRQRLLTVPDQTSVEVVIDGRIVRNATVVVMRLTNTGKTALPSEDWESTLDIEMTSGSVISARQVAAKPTGLRVAMNVLPDRVRIQPFLFNPGDIFDVQVVCENLQASPVPHTRIKNVAGIQVRRTPVYNPGNGLDGELDRSNKVFYFAIFPLMILGLLIFGLAAPSEEGVKPIAISSAIGMSLFLFGFLRWSVKRSRRWRPVERF